jgi:rod shape-determining protein MreD
VNPESTWLRGALVVAFVFIVHEGVLRGTRIDGVRPDLLLGLGIVAGIVAGPERGEMLAFAAALLGDLFVNTPFGLSALVACVVAFLAGSLQATLRPTQRWSPPVLAAVGSVVGELMWAAVGTVLGLPGLLHPHLIAIAVVVAVVNAAFAWPLAILLRWAFPGVAPPTRVTSLV